MTGTQLIPSTAENRSERVASDDRNSRLATNGNSGRTENVNGSAHYTMSHMRRPRGALQSTDTNLDTIFDQEQFLELKRRVQDVCESESDVIGVLLTGSFAQSRALYPVMTVDMTPEQKAYYDICMQKGRKLSYHPKSDLDVWVCLKDLPGQAVDLRRMIDTKTTAIIDWAAQHPEHTQAEFIEHTAHAFDPYYKQEGLYSDAWRAANTVPWMAKDFKGKFMDAILQVTPHITSVIKDYFGRNELDDFVELRAYPVSTFNIKPHMTRHEKGICRDPFPYFIRDLVTLERNCIVLYADKDHAELPYPFNPNGTLLGEEIAKHINWDEDHELHLYTKRFTVR